MDGLTISLKNDNDAECAAKDRLIALLSKYDASPYLFTKDIQIESMAMPHSHPVLTLNSFPYSDENIVLDAFIHEQLHWYLETVAEELAPAVAELRGRYPDAPSGPPFGCRDQNSTYEHLLLCHLAYKALQDFVGENAAKLVLHFLQNHHCLWVYRTIEHDRDYLELLVAKYGLNPIAAPAA